RTGNADEYNNPDCSACRCPNHSDSGDKKKRCEDTSHSIALGAKGEPVLVLRSCGSAHASSRRFSALGCRSRQCYSWSYLCYPRNPWLLTLYMDTRRISESR